MKDKEAIITVVGFLGAGKTTLLKYLIDNFIDKDWDPFVILNDYENANMDAQQFTKQIELNNIKALSGNCICCSGIVELRNIVNRIPERKNGITLIEANGTSDASSLMEFLGVGLNDRFLPPIQISVVDVKNWQKRGEHNELEANQIQVSSLIVLTHIQKQDESRKAVVINELKKLNPMVKIVTMDNLNVSLLPELLPSNNSAQKFDHQKTHWASCSVDLLNLPYSKCILDICASLPKSILRIKGCTKIGQDKNYTYFERKPDGEVHVRPFNGIPITGAKLLTIGPGSNPAVLEKAIKLSVNKTSLF
ncbi:GTP-binding protein [Aquimarina sp. 2201CG5-10]|uniref:GTP-binding protein n=1 Tax=Aquimarina callyspongiae TaxID=3098150 RepID=UPI002AB4F2A7|nr:GTP-binding protein [Aquimarina sp. 2201CG5-10]MDY8137948.1 GTP-binding protein [Aquimarina sp. 2201CG5-10]